MTETPDLKAYTQTRWHETLRILRRRRLLIFSTTMLGFSLSVLTIQSLTPIYTARAQIQFNGKSPTYITTQIEHIRSESLARRILVDTNLGQTKAEKGSAFKTLNLLTNDLGQSAQKIIANELAPQTAEFLKNLDVRPVQNSYIIDLRFHHKNALQSASMLNRLMAYYLQDQASQDEAPPQTGENTLQTLEKNARNALQELQEFEATAHTSMQNTAETSQLYEKAQLRLAEARAKIHPFLDKNGKIIENPKAPVIINSALIQSLKLQRAMLEQEQKRLSMRYGHKHPKMLNVASDFDLVESQIEEESRSIMNRIIAEYDAAKSEANAVQAPETLHNNAAEISKILQQRAHKTQQLYNDALNNAHPAAQSETTFTPAKVLLHASVPTHPSFPNKLRMLGLGTLLSLLSALGLAILLEKTRATFLSGRQLEEFLNFPCYALIPRVQKQKNVSLADYVMDAPASNTAEAIRSLRLTIKLRAHDDKENKVVTITSSHPSEGKTTLAVWMARLAAKSGERVILIDADLRRPSVHKALNQNNTLSLVEYLGKQNKLDEIINTNDPSGLHVIYGRATPNSALDLLASSKMDQLIRALRKAYDLIIIDSPACLAVSDARALTKLSDQIIYAVAWNKTTREIVHSGISQFNKLSNAHMATVLTNIDLKKHVEFGYGEAISDYNAYRE